MTRIHTGDELTVELMTEMGTDGYFGGYGDRLEDTPDQQEFDDLHLNRVVFEDAGHSEAWVWKTDARQVRALAAQLAVIADEMDEREASIELAREQAMDRTLWPEPWKSWQGPLPQKGDPAYPGGLNDEPGAWFGGSCMGCGAPHDVPTHGPLCADCRGEEPCTCWTPQATKTTPSRRIHQPGCPKRAQQ